MKKTLALILAALLLLTLFAGCSKDEPAAADDTSADTAQTDTDTSETDGDASETGDVFKVAWQHNWSDQWHHQTALVGEMRMEEAFDNVEVTLFDSKGDAGNIVPFLEQLIMEGDWDLCIYGTYSDDSEYIKKLQDTGCNVICYAIEWDFLKGVCSTFVCSEYDLGYLAATRAAELLPENANVVVLRGAEGYSGSILRGEGFADALAERDDITVLDEKFCSFDKAKAMTQMEDWITRFGTDIDGILSENDAMALGAIEALNMAGIDAASLVITGIDALYEGCVAIKEGLIDVSAYQSSDLYAEGFIDRIEKLQIGEVDAYCTDDMVFEAQMVTVDNVDEMIARYEELGMAQ